MTAYQAADPLLQELTLLRSRLQATTIKLQLAARDGRVSKQARLVSERGDIYARINEIEQAVEAIP